MKIDDIKKMFGPIRLIRTQDLREDELWADMVECLNCHKDIRISSVDDMIHITEHCKCGRSKEFNSELIKFIRYDLNCDTVDHPGEDEKFQTKKFKGVVKGGRIYLDRKNLFDKPQKCPINIPIPKTPDGIKYFIESLEWLLTKEGYEVSSHLEFEKFRKK